MTGPHLRCRYNRWRGVLCSFKGPSEGKVTLDEPTIPVVGSKLRSQTAMKNILTAPQLQNEEAAFAFVETKLWPAGPVCHHCGVVGRAGRLAPQRTKPSKRNPEGKLTVGVWKCYACRKQFTVRMGSIFE